MRRDTLHPSNRGREEWVSALLTWGLIYYYLIISQRIFWLLVYKANPCSQTFPRHLKTRQTKIQNAAELDSFLQRKEKPFTIRLQGHLKRWSVLYVCHITAQGKGVTVTQMHQKLIQEGEWERKKRYVFFYQQHAIIYLRMKHKLPGTLVTMATIKSIAELFWHLSPQWFVLGVKIQDLQ